MPPQFNVRLTEDDLLDLHRLAMNLGVSPSDAIRYLIRREVSGIETTALGSFDRDVLAAIWEESSKDPPRAIGVLELLNLVRVPKTRTHANFGDQINASLKQLLAHRCIKPSPGGANTWFITEVGKETLKPKR